MLSSFLSCLSLFIFALSFHVFMRWLHTGRQMLFLLSSLNSARFFPLHMSLVYVTTFRFRDFSTSFTSLPELCFHLKLVLFNWRRINSTLILYSQYCLTIQILLCYFRNTFMGMQLKIVIFLFVKKFAWFRLSTTKLNFILHVTS